MFLQTLVQTEQNKWMTKRLHPPGPLSGTFQYRQTLRSCQWSQLRELQTVLETPWPNVTKETIPTNMEAYHRNTEQLR